MPRTDRNVEGENQMSQPKKVWCPAVKDMVAATGKTTVIPNGRSAQSFTLKKLHVESCSRQGKCPMETMDDCVVGKSLEGRW